jgi:hypothetical protein
MIGLVGTYEVGSASSAQLAFCVAVMVVVTLKRWCIALAARRWARHGDFVAGLAPSGILFVASAPRCWA